MNAIIECVTKGKPSNFLIQRGHNNGCRDEMVISSDSQIFTPEYTSRLPIKAITKRICNFITNSCHNEYNDRYQPSNGKSQSIANVLKQSMEEALLTDIDEFGTYKNAAILELRSTPTHWWGEHAALPQTKQICEMKEPSLESFMVKANKDSNKPFAMKNGLSNGVNDLEEIQLTAHLNRLVGMNSPDIEQRMSKDKIEDIYNAPLGNEYQMKSVGKQLMLRRYNDGESAYDDISTLRTSLGSYKSSRTPTYANLLSMSAIDAPSARATMMYPVIDGTNKSVMDGILDGVLTKWKKKCNNSGKLTLKEVDDNVSSGSDALIAMIRESMGLTFEDFQSRVEKHFQNLGVQMKPSKNEYNNLLSWHEGDLDPDTYQRIAKCSECVRMHKERPHSQGSVCKFHLDLAASEYASVMREHKDMSKISEMNLSEAWTTYVSSENTAENISRCDGRHRVWSMPDGYCAYISLRTIMN